MAEDAPYSIAFHPSVPGDLRRLPENVRERILTAIVNRLGRAPDRYGQRLRQSLHGHWKLRVGDHRVVYELVGHAVRVYGVKHRRDVYTSIQRRTSRGWSTGPP